MTTARLPGTAAEVADLPAVLPLFAARFQPSVPGKRPYATPPATSIGLPVLAAPTFASAPVPAHGEGARAATVVNLFAGAATAPTQARVVLHHRVRTRSTSRTSSGRRGCRCLDHRRDRGRRCGSHDRRHPRSGGQLLRQRPQAPDRHRAGTGSARCADAAG